MFRLSRTVTIKYSDSPEVTLSRLKLKGLKGLKPQQAALCSFTIHTHSHHRIASCLKQAALLLSFSFPLPLFPSHTVALVSVSVSHSPSLAAIKPRARALSLAGYQGDLSLCITELLQWKSRW